MQKRECAHLPFKIFIKYRDSALPKVKQFDGTTLFFERPIALENWSKNLEIKIDFDGQFKAFDYHSVHVDNVVVGVRLELEIKDKIQLIQKMSLAHCS
ncbi:MAG: hypothetical protein Fur0010_10590 [Bdellovibrio sp.]